MFNKAKREGFSEDRPSVAKRMQDTVLILIWTLKKFNVRFCISA